MLTCHNNRVNAITVKESMLTAERRRHITLHLCSFAAVLCRKGSYFEETVVKYLADWFLKNDFKELTDRLWVKLRLKCQKKKHLDAHNSFSSCLLCMYGSLWREQPRWLIWSLFCSIYFLFMCLLSYSTGWWRKPWSAPSLLCDVLSWSVDQMDLLAAWKWFWQEFIVRRRKMFENNLGAEVNLELDPCVSGG